MYRNTRSSMRFQTMGTAGSSLGWMVMLPGLFLIAFAIAILIWPQLLAYLIAAVLLVAGISLSLWGWRLSRAARRQPSNGQTVYYEVM